MRPGRSMYICVGDCGGIVAFCVMPALIEGKRNIAPLALFKLTQRGCNMIPKKLTEETFFTPPLEGFVVRSDGTVNFVSRTGEDVSTHLHKGVYPIHVRKLTPGTAEVWYEAEAVG